MFHFDRFVCHVDNLVDHIDMFVDHVDMCVDHVDRLVDHVNKFVDHIDMFVDHVDMLVDRVDRFVQCTHQRMNHITLAEYDEIVNIICSARNAFYMTPGGLVQFNELLQSLRRTKSCKKDLWQRIVNGLASGSV